MKISEYLHRTDKALAYICDFDKNGNEYGHVFYLCDRGDAENEAWKLEIKKMENVSFGEVDEEEAINMGLHDIEDCYNYVDPPAEKRVGNIGHEYGNLLVKEESGKYFWTIEACTFDKWEEIPESLYRELANFKGEQT